MCIFWMQTPGIIVNEKRDKNFWFFFRDLDFYVQCFNNMHWDFSTSDVQFYSARTIKF